MSSYSELLRSCIGLLNAFTWPPNRFHRGGSDSFCRIAKDGLCNCCGFCTFKPSPRDPSALEAFVLPNAGGSVAGRRS